MTGPQDDPVVDGILPACFRRHLGNRVVHTATWMTKPLSPSFSMPVKEVHARSHVRYAEQLTGCIECNCWWGGRSAFIVYLSIEDFQALREGQQKNSAQRRAAIPVEHSSDHVRLIRDSA